MIILDTHCKTNTSEVVKSLDKILKPLMERFKTQSNEAKS